MTSPTITYPTHLSYLLSLVIGLIAGLCSHAASAQVTAPTRGGGVSVMRVTATTMELNFGINGTGQGRVVAVAATNDGMPVRLSIVDGQSYTAATTYGKGAAIGQGYVVYNGSNNTATITGLQPDTYYYIANAEYNADSTGIAYNTRGTSMSIATRSATVNPAPLPVELTSFTGSVDIQSSATLRWTTASERNTAYFAIERSTDGTSFAEASLLIAAGNSSKSASYQWRDPQRLTHVTYYRLRQADLDGSVVYSSVVALVPAPTIDHLVEVYPNPSTGQTIQLLLQGYSGETLKLHLVDVLGRPVLTQVLTPADTRIVIPLILPQGLAAGTYLLTLAGNSSPIQKRIIVSD
jgi:hypothetical protein